MFDELHDGIVGLLARAGLPAAFTAAQMFGGNNRTYRLTSGGRDVVLKVYFQDPGDRRPRLAREFAFLDFAWRHGIRNLPEPLAQDPARNLGLYGFVAGRKLDPGEPARMHVTAAVDFVVALDRLKRNVDAGALPSASEACYSLAAHRDLIERRIAVLSAMDPGPPIHEEARAFARGPLRAHWEAVKSGVLVGARAAGIELGTMLRPQDRCISPSDFGFHNALLTEAGDVNFIDFEYAGWDDPAKLVGDFFNQVAVPAPREHYAEFADRISGLAQNPALQRRRIDLAFPIYQVKWICIVLNDFLRSGNSRRSFSGQEDPRERKRRQLSLARDMLRRIALQGDGDLIAPAASINTA